MNRNRSAAVAASVGLILMSSEWASAQDPDPPRARVRLPIAGTAIGHGKDTFTGTLSIERFAVRGDKIVSVGMVTGRVLDKSGNARGTAVLLVEQNVVAALQIAHRAYVLEEGRIVAEGTPDELLARPEIQRAYLGL